MSYLHIHTCAQAQGGRVLTARVTRSVEGMDMELFRSALEIKRVFDNEIAQKHNVMDREAMDQDPYEFEQRNPT